MVDWSCLTQTSYCAALTDTFISNMRTNCEAHTDPFRDQNVQATIDARWDQMCVAAFESCAPVLPKAQIVKRKPWISTSTLELLLERQCARTSGDWSKESQFHKAVRKSARRDRAQWLQNLADEGSWQSLRALQRGQQSSQTRLFDANGTPVSSDLRADVFAEYLQREQWYVRNVSLEVGARPLINTELEIYMGPVIAKETRRAIHGLKSGKSTRPGDIPIEFFKVIAQEAGTALQLFVDLCNLCLSNTKFPSSWQQARIALIFKKGDPARCENYRPNNLLAVGYKIVACILKQRLLDAGVDALLWPSQYGFRRGRSTCDAIFVARRRIEAANAHRNGGLSMLALDWRRAFDSLHVQCLLDALRRFGLPMSFISIIRSILEGRQFWVKDGSSESSLRNQLSGVSQGCTLSPLLFIMVMSVIMHDAVGMLSPPAREAYRKGALADIVYADDTLLLSVSPKFLQEYLSCVTAAGQLYGLELHSGKLQLLSIRCHTSLRCSDGTDVTATDKMEYLGTCLDSEGSMQSEVCRRLGAAKSLFRTLSKVWASSTLTCKAKLRIFDCLVASKLVYGLQAGCCNVACRRRLDGFQASCLRRVLKILPSFLSRISNKEILRMAGSPKPLSKLVLERQLVLLGKVLRTPEDQPLRSCVFAVGATPIVCYYVRRVGRPRVEWAPVLLDEARRRLGGALSIIQNAEDAKMWRSSLSI